MKEKTEEGEKRKKGQRYEKEEPERLPLQLVNPQEGWIRSDEQEKPLKKAGVDGEGAGEGEKICWRGLCGRDGLP